MEKITSHSITQLLCVLTSHRLVTQLIEEGAIQVLGVGRSNNPADCMTKIVGPTIHEKWARLYGVVKGVAGN